MKKSEFYTLKGYRMRDQTGLTESMEDYLEMIYRHTQGIREITIKDLSVKLNVKPSSVSKMAARLKEQEYILFEKYGTISLTSEGKKIGTYLLWRHTVLKKFFQQLNKEDYHLEQVEKIEHFIDSTTLKNMEKSLK